MIMRPYSKIQTFKQIISEDFILISQLGSDYFTDYLSNYFIPLLYL